MRILLVEDELRLAGALTTALERERFVVDHMDCLATAREAATSAVYDLALLDRNLPDGDGLDLIPDLRARSPGVPILILSALGDVPDRIAGLDEGADDYLIKPVSIDEMLARIRAVRRRTPDLAMEEIDAGNLVYDVSNDDVAVDGVRLDLPRRERLVLGALIRRRGRTVLRESLEQAVFGFDDAVQSNTLDSHISRLRKRLAVAGAAVEIHPVRGVGYLLQVTE